MLDLMAIRSQGPNLSLRQAASGEHLATCGLLLVESAVPNGRSLAVRAEMLVRFVPQGRTSKHVGY